MYKSSQEDYMWHVNNQWTIQTFSNQKMNSCNGDMCYSSKEVLSTVKITNVIKTKHHSANAGHKECVFIPIHTK